MKDYDIKLPADFDLSSYDLFVCDECSRLQDIEDCQKVNDLYLCPACFADNAKEAG